jgi:RNA recognition motif-containing protein
MPLRVHLCILLSEYRLVRFHRDWDGAIGCGRQKVLFLGSATGAQGLAMRKNLYVGNLPYDTTADDLREAFSQFGTVSRSQVISDRETGRSRGFGFVEMEDGADTAIESMNGKDFQGRRLTVNEAKSRSDAGGGGSRSRSTY